MSDPRDPENPMSAPQYPPGFNPDDDSDLKFKHYVYAAILYSLLPFVVLYVKGIVPVLEWWDRKRSPRR